MITQQEASVMVSSFVQNILNIDGIEAYGDNYLLEFGKMNVTSSLQEKVERALVKFYEDLDHLESGDDDIVDLLQVLTVLIKLISPDWVEFINKPNAQCLSSKYKDPRPYELISTIVGHTPINTFKKLEF